MDWGDVATWLGVIVTGFVATQANILARRNLKLQRGNPVFEDPRIANLHQDGDVVANLPIKNLGPAGIAITGITMATALSSQKAKRLRRPHFKPVHKLLMTGEKEVFQAPMDICDSVLHDIIEKRTTLRCHVWVRFSDAAGEHVQVMHFRNKVGKWDEADRLIELRPSSAIHARIERWIKQVILP